MVEVNLFGTFHGSCAAVKQMKQQGSGVIMNVISVSALEGRPGSATYCASKYAVKGLTLSLQKEVEGTGVQVIALYPGGIKTHLYDEQKHEAYDQFMEPEEAAREIVENLQQKNPEEELIIRRIKY